VITTPLSLLQRLASRGARPDAAANIVYRSHLRAELSYEAHVVGRKSQLMSPGRLVMVLAAGSGIWLAACGPRDALGGRPADGGTDAPPSDAARTDASQDSACSPLSSVVFRMEAPPIDGGYYYVSSFGEPGDGVWWYSLEMPDGSAVPIFLPPGASSICNVCDARPNPIGFACETIPDGGVSRGWGGYTVTGTASCETQATSSSPAYSIGCATIRCLPAGRYLVKMCGGRGMCAGGDAATCVEVPFDFPTDQEVVGTLPS
jgi:hypothetical protein